MNEMPLVYPIENQELWQKGWEMLRDTLTPTQRPDSQFAPGEYKKIGETLASFITSKTPEEAFTSGIIGIGPVGTVMPNYRTPQVIQALRKRMSEEMKSRGALSQIEGGVQKMLTPEGAYASIERIAGPNPVDRILRGSWYHGSSPAERNAVRQIGFQGSAKDPEFAEHFLRRLNEIGFQGSTHSGGPAISNVLGEPYGTSLTVLPTKGTQFTQGVDEYIHRVLPMYGGPPPGRTVNLMTPEGRRALNDAYDVVFNKRINDLKISQYRLEDFPKEIPLLEYYATRINKGRGLNEFSPHMALTTETGPFNKQLSQELQNMGKRGILYNPRRWDEYEMLMLDPKYVLPLDYRRVGEYLPKGFERSSSGYHNVVATPPIEAATPGTRKGLSQIQDLMSQNVSRLGEIYSERPWTQRLSEENKRRLLELIDPSYREQVGRQLYEGL